MNKLLTLVLPALLACTSACQSAAGALEGDFEGTVSLDFVADSGSSAKFSEEQVSVYLQAISGKIQLEMQGSETTCEFDESEVDGETVALSSTMCGWFKDSDTGEEYMLDDAAGTATRNADALTVHVHGAFDTGGDDALTGTFELDYTGALR